MGHLDPKSTDKIRFAQIYIYVMRDMPGYRTNSLDEPAQPSGPLAGCSELKRGALRHFGELRAPTPSSASPFGPSRQWRAEKFDLRLRFEAALPNLIKTCRCWRKPEKQQLREQQQAGYSFFIAFFRFFGTIYHNLNDISTTVKLERQKTQRADHINQQSR